MHKNLLKLSKKLKESNHRRYSSQGGTVRDPGTLTPQLRPESSIASHDFNENTTPQRKVSINHKLETVSENGCIDEAN